MLLKGIGLSSSWINSKPLKFDNVLGKVVLIDFWTFSCVNCIRTIPHMNKLYKKYSKKGLVVIGIHTPEFEFEKNESNVKDFIKKSKISYPVVLDPEYFIWNYFANSYWPRQYLFNQSGELIHDHIGEGGYTTIEKKICELLGIRFDQIKEDFSQQTITPEIYFGSLKHTGFGNIQVCRPGSCITYIDQEDHVDDKPYLHGQWIQDPESLKPVSQSYISLKYTAKECNVVAKGKTKCMVMINGNMLTKENAGKDVKIVKGESFILLDSARMYNLVKTNEVQTNEIKLIPGDKTFEIFTFTFG